MSALDAKLVALQAIRNELNALIALAENGDFEEGSAEAEIVAARGDFATLAAAIEACVKGMNVFLNASNFASLFGDEQGGDNTSTAGNFNNIGNNKIYPINLSNGNELANSPGTNITGMLMTFGRTESRTNGDTQIIITAGQAIYSRTYWNNAWTDWNRQTRFSEFNEAINLCVRSGNTSLTASVFESLFGDSQNSKGDFNNIGNNKIYPINLSNGNELANSPGKNINGMLMTFGLGDSRADGDTQMIITFGQAIYNRTYLNNAWSVWNRQVRLSEYNEVMKPWQGLKVSVLGDSISTFPNAIPSGNKCTLPLRLSILCGGSSFATSPARLRWLLRRGTEAAARSRDIIQTMKLSAVGTTALRLWQWAISRQVRRSLSLIRAVRVCISEAETS